MSFLSGIASVASSVLPIANFIEQRRTNQQMVDQAKSARGWEAGMSNTAHQREVEDLKKAGLNPILSAGGQGASTPSASTPALTAPQIDPGPIMNAVSLAQMQEKIDIDRNNSVAGIAKTLGERDLNKVKKMMMEKDLSKKAVQSRGWQLIDKMIKSIERNSSKPPTNMRKELEQIGEQMGYPRNFENLPR